MHYYKYWLTIAKDLGSSIQHPLRDLQSESGFCIMILKIDHSIWWKKVPFMYSQPWAVCDVQCLILRLLNDINRIIIVGRKLQFILVVEKKKTAIIGWWSVDSFSYSLYCYTRTTKNEKRRELWQFLFHKRIFVTRKK